MHEANGPWTIRHRSLVYQNPWIDVTHHDVLHPDGTAGVYGTVHFKNLAVAVLPLDDAGHTWLVGQHRFPLGRYSWEIPEGGCPAGESPVVAAQRELKEETGLVATRWRQILTMDLSNSVTDETAVAFIAQGLSHGPAAPDSSEELVVRRVPFDEVYARVCSGDITDALTVATVLRAKLLLTEA